MHEAIANSLDNLDLGNLRQKITTMREKVRKDIAQDIQYMQLKLNMQANQDQNSDQQLASNEDPNYEVGQGAVDAQHDAANPHQQENQQDPASQQPQDYMYLYLAQPPIDFQEVKRLSGKKISEALWDEYLKCKLHLEVVDRLREVFDEMEDENSKVSTKQLVQHITKLGVKFSEASALEVPLIKRKISLRKVLFELHSKAKKLPEHITWLQFKEAIQDYRFPPEPSIDQYMAEEGLKAKNHYNISPELVNELKSIYSMCAKEMFLSYCPLSSLLAKMDRSKLIQNNLQCLVRPKGNYEVQVSLKDTIRYITSHAPEFIDQDEFLLFFSVKGFTYYPIQQRALFQLPSELSSESSKVVKKVKSERVIPKEPTKRKKHPHFDEYQLSTNNPNSIRNHKLKLMLQEEKAKKEAEAKKSFKAKPVPKSISKEKYQTFFNSMHHKIEEGRHTLEELRSQSQHELERLQKETKLFISPKKEEVVQHYYQITARPPPESIKSPKLAQIQNEKATRRHKILSQTQLKYQNSWQELPLVATLPSPSKETSPKVSFKVPIKDIPDYHAEQARIEQELKQRKAQFQPTEPSPFNFHTAERHPPREKAVSPAPSPTQHYDYKHVIYSPEPEIYYTQKFADMVVANKKKAFQKEQQTALKLQEDLQREKRHQNFAKFMKAHLSKVPDTAKICQNEAKMKIERHKKYWKNLDREHQSNLNQLYAKILKRPFLYELQSPSKHPTPPNAEPKKAKERRKGGKRASNRSL